MKRVMVIIIAAIMIFSINASADILKQDQDTEIYGVCSLKVINAKDYDVFMNQESGSSKEFLVVSLSLLNLKKDPLYVKTEISAKLVYDNDYEFEPEYLWVNPEGSYYCADTNSYLYIFEMDENGMIYSDHGNHSSGNNYSTTTAIESSRSQTVYYDPINVRFYCGDDPSMIYDSSDPSKTVLDPLVSRVFHYVFVVPDMAAEDEGLRTFIITVDNEEFELQF